MTIRLFARRLPGAMKLISTCAAALALAFSLCAAAPSRAFALQGCYIADAKGNHLEDGSEVNISDVRRVTVGVYESAWAFTEGMDYFCRVAGLLSVVCNETGQDMMMDHSAGFMYPVDREGHVGADYQLYPMQPGYTYTFTVGYGVWHENNSSTQEIVWSESITVSKSKGDPTGGGGDGGGSGGGPDPGGDGGGAGGGGDAGKGDGGGTGGGGSGGGASGPGTDQSDKPGGGDAGKGDTGTDTGGVDDPNASDNRQSDPTTGDTRDTLTDKPADTANESGTGDNPARSSMNSPVFSPDSSLDGDNPAEADGNSSSVEGAGAQAGASAPPLSQMGTVLGLSSSPQGSDGQDDEDSVAAMTISVTGWPVALLVLCILFAGAPLAGMARRYGWFRYGLARRSRLSSGGNS